MIFSGLRLLTAVALEVLIVSDWSVYAQNTVAVEPSQARVASDPFNNSGR
jgi:hypothetical protein